MSHLVSIAVTIDDLDALKAACKALGLQWIQGKKEFAWYGQSVGDFPLPEGFTAADLGKCDHAIAVPDSTYEIGVVRNKVGKGYSLMFDYFGSGRGRVIKEKLGGEKLPLLVQAYGVQRTIQVAKRQGCAVRQVKNSNGSISLILTGRGI